MERTLRFETERAKTRANRDLSAARMAARATLAAQRQKIADETFSKAREQLAAFAAGKDYAAWLQKEAASLAETLGENAHLPARAAALPQGAQLAAMRQSARRAVQPYTKEQFGLSVAQLYAAALGRKHAARSVARENVA